ncbi:uncharacterized protein K460DRAFT_323380 [Cucurbitaria berberidis CBS 394.84]|uniref:Pal1-domain-containing protein n=1 Tax=Cucurbitaria berberidis CBS 394.84 TaxID=1168544 RepID=A0A9P4G7P9_9PLEO|nr:uncharacterized protein K460DRAFT_323380 [Cucurbitaria berberidis CBS 394.84]KAF1840572.1 hypothetical protein K460DRAFT_323380 [Cucurbitaria berberidis CBS 394.84]
MEQARHALIDPLIEPDPSDETGLNTRFRSTFAPQEPITPPGSTGIAKGSSSVNVQPQHTGSSVETNPYRRSRVSTDSKSPSASVTPHGQTTPKSRRSDYPSPPNSASPRRAHFSDNHRAETLGFLNEGRPRRSSNPAPSSSRNGRPARSGSLSERYPGDKSHRPLDILRKDEKVAHRAPHLRKKNFQGADIIDRLDKSGVSQYHHEGPYDAANIARNKHVKYAPIAAVKESNLEALRATPRENIVDAVTRHRPLEGVAIIPPGMPDRFGRVLNYQEGADLQREPGGDYRRWAGVDYHPDDLKGKGEPSYTIEKALKDHKTLGDNGTEMTSRHKHSKSVGYTEAPGNMPSETLDAEASGIGRSKSMGGTLKKRFGSIRRRKQDVEA